MHDLRTLRTHLDTYRQAFARRGFEHIIDEISVLDVQNRKLMTQSQQIQTERNALSKVIGTLKAQKQDKEASVAMEAVAGMKQKMAEIEQEQGVIAEQLHGLLSSYPNILEQDVPDGVSEDDNVEIKKWGMIKEFSFTPLEHDVLGKMSGDMDFEAAALVSGARFVYLKNHLARLERAIANFMIDTHTTEFGYTEISPPVLVRDNALFGTGQLPKFAEDLFTIEGGGYRLIPTSEVPLTNLVREQILSDKDLPLRFVALTQCFRSEAGSSGKDTKGMIRQHQFSKVELVSVVPPTMSDIEHARMLECAETILQKLELPFRTMLLCSGDTGFSAQKTFDIEVWLPAQGRYREISSCSNCGAFQARRMNARFKTKEGQNEFVHTLNGSGLAVGRTLVAIMENYQNEDGSVTIPDVLRPYMGGMEKIYGA